MIPGIPLPNLSLGLSKELTSGANGNGFETAFASPFAFDNSGWNVSLHSTGNQSAQGSTGQASGAGRSPLDLAGILGGIDPKWLLLAGAAYLLLRKK
jgi:hypothetical protein